MRDLADGETTEIKGSAAKPYVLKNTGGVYSCSCPAWRNQSKGIEQRTCKHLVALRGEAAERERVAAFALLSASVSDALSAAPRRSVPREGAPPVLLAERWDGGQDLAGWWMSEKLDGVRAWWDGRQFLSRQGNAFRAPAWFCEGLPATPLDGELWGGRKRFQRTVSVVRRQDASDHWKDILFLVFDAPAVDEPFETRLERLREMLDERTTPWARAHPHAVCRGEAHLREELARVEALGGEGLMLRQPGSRYEAGRSVTLLKVKSFLDAEGRVVEHVPGAGRHKGRLGALVVQLPDGHTFSVGTGFSDAEREAPPPVGAIIRYRYQELSDGGIPRFPIYVGLRDDVAWEEVEAPVAGAPTPVADGPSPARPLLMPEGQLRRFEQVEGKSSKFWEIAMSGAGFEVRFGRISTAGQQQVKEFPTPEQARHEADRLIAEKLRKGYRECGE